MPRIDQLLTESPASVTAMRNIVGVTALETLADGHTNRLNALEAAVEENRATMTLVPNNVTILEDAGATGNVFSNDSTTIGTLRVLEYWVQGMASAIAPGIRTNIPNIGSIVLYQDGEYDFESNLNWHGTVPTITFMATNGVDTRMSSLAITVTSVDDPPVANPNAAMTPVNVPVTINVLANDYDPEGNAVVLTHVNSVAVVVGQTINVPNGTVTVDANSILTFTPASDYEGTSQFFYTVSDGVHTANGRVDIQVGFENMPLFSPVAKLVEGDFYDACARNFGNTYMGWYGPAYGNGTVVDDRYTSAQGRFSLNDREPWLYDRATQIYKLYLRTGEAAIRERALEIAEIYFNGVAFNGSDADFVTGGGQAQDPKYQYPIIAWWYEKETGDMRYRAHAAGMYNMVYRVFPPTYSEDMALWTERNCNYALQACLVQYWLTGDTVALSRAEAYFEMLIGMAAGSGAPLHPHGQHEGTGISTPVSSPWMTGMLVETLIQLYRTNEDTRILEWIARYCDFVVDRAFYVNYEVAGAIGHRIPAYLVGTSVYYADPGGAGPDAEHCYDVAILLQKGIWAKQLLGQDTTEMQQVVFEQLTVAEVIFNSWIRGAAGYPRYRVNPSRKYGWWFNGAYSTIISAGAIPRGPIITVQATLSGNAEVGSTLTCAPGTYLNSPVITRQWYRDTTPIDGATGLTYVTQVEDTGLEVWCEETATANGVTIVRRTSSSIIPTAAGMPTITAQPTAQTVTAGQNATFTFTASGTGITYGWESRPNSGGSWTPISGADTNTYVHANAQQAQTGMQFRGRASNGSGTVYTSIVALTVNAPAAVAPQITTQPSNQTVQDGSPVSLSVVFTGTAPVAIQWYTRIAAGAWQTISGATTANFQSAALALADNGREYQVRLSNAAGNVTSNTVVVTVEAIPEELELVEDLSYVAPTSAARTAFFNFVNNKRSGGNPYGYMPADAALAYRLTGDESYRTLAIAGVNQMVTTVENQIAANQNATEISGDSYLEVGPKIGGLAMVYAWCNPDQPTKDRWAAVADQAIYNLWNHNSAQWGGNSFPWTGWSVNDPGNNYHYSFLTATAYWALASNNHTWIQFLNTQKLPPLRNYFANLEGGGSREGTGYGAAFRALFAFYQIWQDSGMPNLSASNSHLDDSIPYWIHATMPGLSEYCPIGDLARESYPNLFDYHRELMLRMRHLTEDTGLQDDASWWLNNISVQVMSQGFMHSVNMLPAGTNTTTPPAELSYYSAGTGCVFSRTSWEDDAVFMHFLAGIYDQSHAAQSQGSFALYKEGFLTVTNNIYSHSGIQQSVRSNNVLRFMTSGGTTIGQNNGTATQTNEIGANGDFTATANLKPIINNATVTSWQRQVEFTNGILTVRDNYTTTSGTTAVFQVCTPVQPVRVGNVITAGDLQITVITPGSPTITLVQASTEDSDFNSGWRVDISGGVGSYVVELRSLSHSPNLPGDTPVSFTSHPSNQSVNAGQNATFSVATTGTTPISYQWQFRPSGGSWTDVSGQTSSTYTRSAVLGDNGGEVRCAATNVVGTVYSNPATLAVASAPTSPSFTAHPTNQSVVEGETATFTVTVTDYTDLQWQFMASGGSWTNVVGETGTTYARVTTLADHNGQVRCVATNAVGPTNSNAATLSVQADLGDVDPLEHSVMMNAVADGVYRSGNLFPGGKSFTMQMLLIFDEGTPDTWLNGNMIGGILYTGRQHTIGINGSKLMGIRNNESTNTQNFAVEPGKWYLASLTSDGGENLGGILRLTFQEYEGETDPALLVSQQVKGEYFGANNAMQHMAYGAAGLFSTNGWPRGLRMQSMRCYSGVRTDTQLRADRRNTDPTGALWWWDAIDNGSGGLSIVDRSGNNVVPNLAGTLELGEGPAIGGGGTGTAPSFTTQPTNQTITDGDAFNFTVVVAGDPTPTLEWQRNIGGTWTAVGDTDASFGGTGTTSMNGYEYRCAATNSAGTTYSNTVTLTVEAAGGGAGVMGMQGAPTGSVPGSYDRGLATVYTKGAGRINRITAQFVPESSNQPSAARVYCYAVSGGTPTALLWASELATIPGTGGEVEFGLPTSGLENTDAAGSYALAVALDDFTQRFGTFVGQTGRTTFVSYGSLFINPPPATFPTPDTTYADIALAVAAEYA